MGKKMDEAEVKKECPSCGLGVALDSTVCEFCGWDFEEEDEWILQIEKLERDLMIEKQKFEPGTVSQRIESTLHTPSIERIEQIRARQEQGDSGRYAKGTTESPHNERSVSAKPVPSPPPTYGEQRGLREAKPSEMEVRKSSTILPQKREEMPKPVITRTLAQRSPEPEAATEPGPAKVRRVRTVKAPKAEEAQQQEADSDSGRTRLVRRVKK